MEFKQARFPRSAAGALAGAGALASAGAIVIPFTSPGPLSDQMIQHLALMSVAAPIVASLSPASRVFQRGGVFALACAMQIALLWAWHAPGAQSAIAQSLVLHGLALAGLAAASVAFWRAVIEAGARAPWRAIAGLLVTGKLACLLGALMIFAPRDLYQLGGLAFALCSSGPSSLDDQHLAGLLMISACPISYLVAGVVIAAQTIAHAGDGETRDRAADAVA